MGEEKKRSTEPFVMFPANLTDDQRTQRLKRKGGYEAFGLYVQLCFKLHNERQDGLEASMKFDLDQGEDLDDLCYSLNYTDNKDKVKESIKLMIESELLTTFTSDNDRYIKSPDIEKSVLKIKETSQRQRERRLSNHGATTD